MGDVVERDFINGNSSIPAVHILRISVADDPLYLGVSVLLPP